MKPLELPEQLKGPWQHALILTYGLDVPFFENALWQQFDNSCRNKVILADGRRYLEACKDYARSRLVRYLNHRYVAEGIFATRAAHAKLMLLTNSERGRLLVGSGNLGMQGFASGGEIFAQYEYEPDSPDTLSAFLAVRELVEGIAQLGYISSLAQERINRIWEGSQWIFQAAPEERRPVRHNLTTPFLDQLLEEVDGETVEELWVLSPFFDRELKALSRMLDLLNPQKVTLLVQPGQTSVDHDVLQRLVDGQDGRCQVLSFRKGDDNPYVHAKLYLLRLPDRALCLQGSPNLSQIAMLRSIPEGNIELANLLAGSKAAFDHLLDELQTQPAGRLDQLDLSFRPSAEPAEELTGGLRLTNGEWRGDCLRLGYQGTLPDLDGASLIVAGREFRLDVSRAVSRHLEVMLSNDAESLLGKPVPISIRWISHAETIDSNPIFACDRAALDKELQVEGGVRLISETGDLDLDDEELENLLGELEAALPVDRRSVWQLAGRTPPASSDDDDDALRLDYADVDYEMLRQHPKIQQYSRRGIGQPYRRTRLQIILSAITDHFRGLLDVSEIVRHDPAAIEILRKGEGEAETEEEREQEDEEKRKRRQSQSKRIARLLRSFFRRYLNGLQSPDFIEFAGYEVIGKNYVIFTHILFRLFIKERVEAGFLVKSLLQTWSFFWGNSHRPGYYWQLDQSQQFEVLQWFRKRHSDAEQLAALYHSGQLKADEVPDDLRFRLRDFWRGYVLRLPFEVNDALLEETWRIVASLCPYQPPRPLEIVEGLRGLLEFETEDSVLAALARDHGLARGSCSFSRVKVHHRKWKVKCIVVDADDALPDSATALAMLKNWMRFEQIDYYRIQAQPAGCVVFYDVLEQQGTYWAKDRDTPKDFGALSPSPRSWDDPLDEMQRLAAELDAGLTLPIAKHTAAAPLRKSTGLAASLT